MLGCMDEPNAISVECYAGYRADERPCRFRLSDRWIEVAEVLDRWIGIDHRYFKVRGDDGDLYILRQDSLTDRWELIMFQRGGR